MVINIPLSLDEKIIEEKVQSDYEKHLITYLEKMVDNILADEYSRRGYYGQKDKNKGLKLLIEDQLDLFIKEHKDLIIEKAADKLAERLSKTKKAKEILESM